MRFGNQLAVLALLVGVLAPTACVLWFMNVAIENQRGADRQKLTEAYRGQLTLLRDRADAYWQNRAGSFGEGDAAKGLRRRFSPCLIDGGRRGFGGGAEGRRAGRVPIRLWLGGGR